MPSALSGGPGVVCPAEAPPSAVRGLRCRRDALVDAGHTGMGVGCLIRGRRCSGPCTDLSV